MVLEDILRSVTVQRYLNLFISSSLTYLSVYADDINTNPERLHMPSDLFVYSPDYTFNAYFNALILQPTSSNLQYSLETISLSSTAPSWDIYEIKPSYHFGFDVGIGAVFHDANSSLTLDWEYFHSHDSNKKHTSSEGDNAFTPVYEVPGTASNASHYKKTKGTETVNFNEINLDYKTFINVGNLLKIDLFSGISSAQIKQKLYSNFSSTDGTKFLSTDSHSTFTGAGPQLGVDFSQKVIKGLNFNGSLAAALVVGSQKNHTSLNSYTGATVITQYISPKSKIQLVPNLEGHLGLAYLITFCKHYMMNLEAGYKAQVYFNPIQTTSVNNETTPFVISIAPTVPITSFKQVVSNFALAGPYIMLSFGF